MPNEFLATGGVAEEYSQKIQSIGGNFSQMPNVDGGRTTLDVIATMKEIPQKIETINTAYKELLSKDATTITNIKSEYDELDKELSDNMGIE